MSFVVVINGPDANAGLILNRCSTKGVIVPIKDDNKTTVNKANETTNGK